MPRPCPRCKQDVGPGERLEDHLVAARARLAAPGQRLVRGSSSTAGVAELLDDGDLLVLHPRLSFEGVRVGMPCPGSDVQSAKQDSRSSWAWASLSSPVGCTAAKVRRSVAGASVCPVPWTVYKHLARASLSKSVLRGTVPSSYVRDATRGDPAQLRLLPPACPGVLGTLHSFLSAVLKDDPPCPQVGRMRRDRPRGSLPCRKIAPQSRTRATSVTSRSTTRAPWPSTSTCTAAPPNAPSATPSSAASSTSSSTWARCTAWTRLGTLSVRVLRRAARPGRLVVGPRGARTAVGQAGRVFSNLVCCSYCL